MPKILHSHAVLHGRLPDANPQLRQTATNFLDPSILLQNGERLGHCFIQGLGCHVDRVISSGEVAARDLARAEGHEGKDILFAFYSPSSHGLIRDC